ncbi:glycosyltransferase [Aquimarina sp. RZ0]|uniref:glycosyltransferase n=1 Tax=Aquimarina sp. RZ0 TaxID=2607730 RepID=UPI0011F320C2|nr:glycosyltransferase [Aquimarina sp. RZ0]KAA1244330.1 glycosyltransferase family 4 protein [Aquimarina sp. RZ0]
MKKIKIAHILNSVGGVDVSLRLILENINPDVVDSFVIHGDNDTSKDFTNKRNEKVKDYQVPIQREINLLRDIDSIYKTIKILKVEKPDLIHAHSAKGGIIARIASLFYKVQVLHTPQAYSYLSTDSKLKRFLFLGLERIFRSFNSVLLASSNSELQRGINEVGYKKLRTELFNNSILPIKLKENNTNYPITWPRSYICTVGRPSYQKNIEMMIEVLNEVRKKIPDIHLVLMGVGEYSPNLENVKKLIKDNLLKENVTLVKWIDREEIFKIISNSRLYISTARYEGLPYSIIESIALSKACVVTNCDGNRDLVIDGYNGFVIGENDISSMSDKIVEIYNNDVLRLEMEKNSLDFFNDNFNINVNIEKLEKKYQKYSI